MDNKSVPESKLSTLDSWNLEYNVKCNCDRGNTASYFCNVEGCADAGEKFYCMECTAEDHKHISHKPIKIKVELQTRI
jgi:hypothetical protein